MKSRHEAYFNQSYKTNTTEVERQSDSTYQATLELKASHVETTTPLSTQAHIDALKQVKEAHCTSETWSKYCNTLNFILLQAAQDVAREMEKQPKGP